MSNSPGSVDRPVVLLVLDGWGHSPHTEGNAIKLGSNKTWQQLWEKAPRTLLNASGLAVGLPDGQMGNSEVGHLNLGAGRTVAQDIVRISDSIVSGDFHTIPALTHLCQHVKNTGGTLHLMGLVGKGGVHAIDSHMDGALEMAKRNSVARVAVHAFLDGRDTPPRSAAGFVEELETSLKKHSTADTKCILASMSGRYFAMDRDKRWERVRLAYEAMVHGKGPRATDAVTAIRDRYEREENDEFIEPVVLAENGAPRATIQTGDAVFCINFRSDRMRQIVSALAVEDFDGFDDPLRPSIELATMTQYHESFPFPAAFAPRAMTRILAEVIANAGLTQFRTAETEKYAHVTYFFNGGIEVPYSGEERSLVQSQKVATYDLKPEMSAAGITDTLCNALAARNHSFYLCNFANGDMVGHSGKLDATIKATQTVDGCLAKILDAAETNNAVVMVTADHGNCEQMIDPTTGGPHTAHTTNLVPFVVFGDHRIREMRDGGSLKDVAPTVLNYLGVEVPDDMTGTDLRAGIK